MSNGMAFGRKSERTPQRAFAVKPLNMAFSDPKIATRFNSLKRDSEDNKLFR